MRSTATERDVIIIGFPAQPGTRPPSTARASLRPLVFEGPVNVGDSLVESAQQWWRAMGAPHLLALVRAGSRFEPGPLVERPQTTAT